MNFLAKDLVPTSVVAKVTEVAKIFWNCRLPKALRENEGTLRPLMYDEKRCPFGGMIPKFIDET